MKTKETSIRKQALAYFNSLSSVDQQMLTDKYFNERHRQSLTGREIEEIWRKETQLENAVFNNTTSKEKPNQKQYSQEEVDRLLDQQAARTTAQIIENKKKQFKQANPELISAYFDKFSKQDLENVILPLLQTKIKTI